MCVDHTRSLLGVSTTCEVGFVWIDVAPHLPQDAGSRADHPARLPSALLGLAPISIFLISARSGTASIEPNRRVNGVECPRFMESPPIP